MIRLDVGEVRLLMPNGNRVSLYQISSDSGMRYTNGILELRGKDLNLSLVRNGDAHQARGLQALRAAEAGVTPRRRTAARVQLCAGSTSTYIHVCERDRVRHEVAHPWVREAVLDDADGEAPGRVGDDELGHPVEELRPLRRIGQPCSPARTAG